MESFEELKRNQEYLFYVAVNRGFIQSAESQTTTRLRRLERSPNGAPVNYGVLLAPGQSSNPNHFGARGQLRGKEAKELAEYFDSIARNNIEAWLLDLEGHKLWTKDDGFVKLSEDTFSYHDFLGSINPPLNIIRANLGTKEINAIALERGVGTPK